MNRIVILIAAACGITSAVLCWKVLGRIPHIPDELSYLYQARILASGNLSVEQPEVPGAFTVPWDHILRNSGRWSTIYPPGWPILLAVGWLLHAPWLINPLLLSFSIPGIFLLAKQLFDDRTALFAVIAFSCSPFVLLMSAGFMAHPSTLCFAVWCAVFLARARRTDYILAGLTGAFAFAIRPYTAVPLILPFLIWTLWKAQNRKRAALYIAAGGLPVFFLFCAYNLWLFGSLLRAGYSYDSAAHFRGSLLNYFSMHVPWYFSRLNKNLWGWPWPDLLIFLPLLLPHEKWRTEVVLVFCFLVLLFAYSIFYYKDIVYSGPRYVYESLGFLAILAGRSIRVLEVWFQRWFRINSASILLLLFAYPLVSTLPLQMDYHRQAYHGQSRELLDLVELKGIGRNALILISGEPHVFRSFYLENSLNPADSERIFARDIPEMHDRLVKAYGRTEIWSMQIELTLLNGANDYPDRAMIRSVNFQRLR